MSTPREMVLAQIDALFADCGMAPDQPPPGWEHFKPFGQAGRTQLTTRALALIDRLAPSGSEYRRAAREPFETGFGSDHTHALARVMGVVAALRTDVELGYTESFAALLRAELFGDFLEMADELQTKGFKDPAAVVAGSVLEEHLRKLAIVHGVPSRNDAGEPLKAERVNTGLAGADAYNTLEQKQVTAWLDIRNKSAHGEYDEYAHAQVAALIQGIRDFLIRHPA